MKATVRYNDFYSGSKRQITFEVERNEVNFIVRRFIELRNVSRATYIDTVKCGRYQYVWKGSARGAFVN